MLQNTGMIENLRLFFSILWLVMTGCLLASILAWIITWGGYTDYVYTAAALWVIASIGAIYTSL